MRTVQIKRRRGKILLGLFTMLLCGGFAGVSVRAGALTDHALMVEELISIRQHHWPIAMDVARRARDPLAVKLYDWLYYTENGGPVDFSDIAEFVRRNPDWPRQGRLHLMAERAIPDNLPDATVIAWFAQHGPQTPNGMDHYLVSLMRSGQTAQAGEIFRGWWKAAQLDPQQQSYFAQRYGQLLDERSDILRLNILLSRGQYLQARDRAQALGDGYPALAEARMAFGSGRSDAESYLVRVPAALRHEPGLLLDQLRWRLRQNDDYAAIDILHAQPPVADIPNPDDWWAQRNILIRHLIANRQFDSAYLLAQDHGLQPGGTSYVDAEFIAGWLALRFLNKPGEAFAHFEALYKSAETPVSRARGAYWAGRASEGLNYTDIARQWYQTAARNQTTFYGQLAITALKDQFRPPQQLPPERTLPGKEAFDRNPLVRAAHYLDEAGLNDETSDMLDKLAEDANTPEDYRLTAELAEALDHPQVAVRIAKKGLNKGILLMDQLYPTILNRMRHVTIEWALAHALIRQESGFDVRARSPVGALGLMQLMPATAQLVAVRNHLPYRPDLLISNPDYNIELGSLYFKQVLDRFDGSYPLALAAYNAGPNRVSEWMAKFGDPRHGSIDIADWIELIPLSETRNYVQRVLEGVYVYRLKLRGVQHSFESPVDTGLQGNY